MKNKMIWEFLKKKNPSFYVGVPVYFWQASAILGEFFDGKDVFMKKASVPVLVIDDITKVENDKYNEAFDLIIRKRELNALPTILTSQRPMESMEDFFGTPIADLLQGNFTELQIVSESRRGRSGNGEEKERR
jgi:DNA replication protein DnaC